MARCFGVFAAACNAAHGPWSGSMGVEDFAWGFFGSAFFLSGAVPSVVLVSGLLTGVTPAAAPKAEAGTAAGADTTRGVGVGAAAFAAAVGRLESAAFRLFFFRGRR